jgi:hypothetical protein
MALAVAVKQQRGCNASSTFDWLDAMQWLIMLPSSSAAHDRLMSIGWFKSSITCYLSDTRCNNCGV